MSSISNDISKTPEISIIARLEPGTAGITKSEARTFEGIAVGYRRKQFAEIIHRNIKTVDSQLEAALSKLGVHNVPEAIALLCAEGKLTFEVLAKTARHLVVLGFVVSSLAQLLANEPIEMRRLRFSGSSIARLARREVIV